VSGRTPLVGRDAAIGQAVGLLTAGAPGVVLAGPAGIGRSRVLETCAVRAAESGFLLVEGWPAPDVASGALVVADDLHLLTDDDARSLAAAVADGDVRLLGTLRTGVRAPIAVTRAWRDGDWERVELEPLARADVAELASHVAGLPVDGISVERLMTWTGGIPADLVAVLEVPVPDGWFEARGPVAALRAGFPPAAALALRAGSQPNEAPPAVRTAGELVALGRRVPDALLVGLVGIDAVADAETRGLVRTCGDDADLAWQPASPLEGELTRAILTEDTTVRRRGALATALAAVDARDADAILLRGEACLDQPAGHAHDVALLVDAADVALERREIETATRLARAAWDHGKSMEAALLLGSALELMGDPAARAGLASDALAAATDDRSRVIAAEQLATALSTLDRHDDAVRTVERTRRTVSDPLWVGRLDALLANLLLHEAVLDRAIALAEPYLGVPLAAPDAAMLVTVAATVGGRTADALGVAKVGTNALGAVAGEHRTAMPSILHVAAGLAHTEAGDLDRADETIGPVYDEGVARGDRTAQAWAALGLGRVALVRGTVRSAMRWFREAVAGFGEQRQTGYLAWAYSGLAGAAALAGDLDEAGAAARAWANVGSHAVRLYEPDSQRLLAGLPAAKGSTDDAAARLEAAAAQARASGQFVVEAACLHDLARLGRAEDARALLSEGARACDGSLVPARLAHIDAVAGGDADGVEQAAKRFERLGAWLLAAEAWAGLAALTSGRAVARTALRAYAAAARCEEARPPGLAALPRPALSARAREVAELAAAGLSRATVAEHLHLSRHTVNRHIQDAYESLGVRARSELSEALADLAVVEGRGKAPAGPGDPWPFVGRERELATLRAAVTERDHAGVALVGRSGVGKTRLARRLERELAAQGWSTAAVAAGATSGLALSDAAARLIPGTKSALLVVDDAQQLDDDGVAGLRRVLAARDVFVVLTVRTDDPAGRRPPSEWSRRDLLAVEVEPLPLDEVARLLAGALGGPVLRTTTEALAAASGGNPLWLRELVHAARADTRLQPRDGVWQLTDVGAPNPRLVDLVRSHLTPLDADARMALGGLAAAGPLPGPLVERVVSPSVLDRLERSGLVEHDPAGAIRLAHPVYGDTLRVDLPAVARHVWYARLVDASVALGPETVDAVQLVSWRIEAGVGVPTRLMVAAAERALALGDLAAADRLARRALASGAAPATHLVIARVCEARGELEPAARAYEAAAASLDPIVRARAALGGSELLAWSTGDEESARALVQVGLEAQPPDPWPEVLRAGLDLLPALTLRGYDGDPDADVDSSIPEVALRKSIERAAARLTAGPSDRAVEESERAHRLVTEGGTPLLGALVLETRAIALAADGRQLDADDLVARTRAVAIAAGDRIVRTGCDLAAGRLALVRGRPATAASSFRDARADPLLLAGSRRWRAAQAGLVHALALGGDHAAAAAALADLGDAPDATAPEEVWATAWLHLAAHERARAIELFELVAESAAAIGVTTFAAVMLHDALVAGGGARIARRLVALGDQLSGVIPDAMLAHAAAVLASDPVALLAAADQLATIGTEHAAGEVAARAAALAAERGLLALAGRAVRVSERWRARCEGAIRLALVPTTPAARLSPRQQEIAGLASAGATAAEIARQLGLSIRTVENHLQAAYERLGVNRRGDLAEALGAA
jgi:DNA-binding CsgD family transcriptional regulator